MTIKAIITGATGMVGEGVLLECLDHPDVEQILVLNRKPGGVSHPKLREIIHAHFFNLAPIERQLTGYNACFFCLGVSSIGMDEADYRHVTYDLTLNVGQLLVKLNPKMTFCYVTGKGTDSSEQGRIAWARVKGATGQRPPDGCPRSAGTLRCINLLAAYVGSDDCLPDPLLCPTKRLPASAFRRLACVATIPQSHTRCISASAKLSAR